MSGRVGGGVSKGGFKEKEWVVGWGEGRGW